MTRMTFLPQREPSVLFGEKFPVIADGKRLLLSISQAFADEFNQAAKLHFADYESLERAGRWIDLTVTSAYPTTAQQCPRIAVQRMGSTPKLAGIGMEIETRLIQTADGEIRYRTFKGQMVTDRIECTVCTLNERMRDDLFLWYQQYLIDAASWILPQLPDTYDLRCTNAVDDVVEYQGGNAQPGFEFYVARLDYQVQYDLVVLHDVDQLRTIVNWQECLYKVDDE